MIVNKEKIAEELVEKLWAEKILNRKTLVKIQREVCQKYHLPFFTNVELLQTYHKLRKGQRAKSEGRKTKSSELSDVSSEQMENLLKFKQTRSLSGIVVVSVLTKPYPCPGHCLYCPTQKGVPKSYLAHEPAVMRAIACQYDPYRQTMVRLRALQLSGHPIDKINIRVIGGTWSYYPKQYQTWFITEVFRACNEYGDRSIGYRLSSIESSVVNRQSAEKLKTNNLMNDPPATPELARQPSKARRPGPSDGGCGGKRTTINQNQDFNIRISDLRILQPINESARCRIVEISIETRPDFIDRKEIKRLRQFGVTKVELGVQSLYNDILKINRRGHSISQTIQATRMLKEAGFKVSYQMMANLPGSNISRDKKMFRELFANPDFRPDHLKIYPLALVKEAPLYKLYQQKKFRPYTKKQLLNLLLYAKKQIPYYCRVERIIRDIPAKNIVAGGASYSNLRQVLTKAMKKAGQPCRCIRCREIRNKYNPKETIYLFREEYDASAGKEIFLSWENKNRTKLYSILRLRIPTTNTAGVEPSNTPAMERIEVPHLGGGYGNKNPFLPVLQDAAIIREIHTYGQEVAISKHNKFASQHRGLGKKLLAEAEKITKNLGLKKIAVIAGVGARGYFRQAGYELKESYLLKNLN